MPAEAGRFWQMLEDAGRCRKLRDDDAQDN